MRPCSKLDYQRFGHYIITGKISDVAFRLDLPPHMHLHPVFHVSLLEPYTTSSIPSRLTIIVVFVGMDHWWLDGLYCSQIGEDWVLLSNLFIIALL